MHEHTFRRNGLCFLRQLTKHLCLREMRQHLLQANRTLKGADVCGFYGLDCSFFEYLQTGKTDCLGNNEASNQAVKIKDRNPRAELTFPCSYVVFNEAT